MNPQTLASKDTKGQPVFAPMIVAEVTKNWVEGEVPSTPILCQRFEQIIRHNNDRGYRLHDWKMTTLYKPAGQAVLGEGSNQPACMTETIVAIFERVLS